MAQYLLVSFNQSLDPSYGKSIDDLLRNQCNGLVTINDFPVAKDVARFSNQDQLYKVATDLEKLDSNTCGLLTRVTRSCHDIITKVKQDNANGFSDICSEQFGQVETLPTFRIYNEEKVPLTLDEYLQHWQWCESIWSIHNTNLDDLYTSLSQEIQKQEEELRLTQANFTEAGNKITSIRRRKEGSLLVRSLDEIGSSLFRVTSFQEYTLARAGNNNIYVQTRNLQTYLVVVKKSHSTEFEKTYYTVQCVVPKSLSRIEEDNEYICYSVTIVKEHLDEFKLWLKDNNYHLREFNYDENHRNKVNEEVQTTIKNYLQACQALSNQLNQTFSHVFIVWTHIKALRIFAESTLTYGIPPNFKAFLLVGNAKNLVKVTKLLDKTFEDGLGMDDDSGVDSEYHPYVCFHLNITPFRQLAK